MSDFLDYNTFVKDNKYLLDDYLHRRFNVNANERTNTTCPICNGHNCFKYVPSSNKTIWKCFHANHTPNKASGDVFELIKQADDVDLYHACKTLSKEYNITIPNRTLNNNNSASKPLSKMQIPPDEPTNNTPPQKNYVKFLSNAETKKYLAINYLQNVRGLRFAETIAKTFNLGYVENFKYNIDNELQAQTNIITIPFTNNSFAWRSVSNNEKRKIGSPVMPLNLQCIFNPSVKYIFIVEGEFDCFALIDIAIETQSTHFSAISVSSINNLSKFLDTYICPGIHNAHRDDITLILLGDNDTKVDTRKAVSMAIQKGLDTAMAHHIPCIIANSDKFYNGAKDTNEALISNRTLLYNSIITEINNANTINIEEYHQECNEVSNRILSFSDDLNGMVARALYVIGDKLKYCQSLVTSSSNTNAMPWYYFDGVKLKQDTTNTVPNMLFDQIPPQLELELKELERKNKDNPDKNKILAKFISNAKTIKSKSGIQQTLYGLQMQRNIAIEQNQLDPVNLLNCKDSTLDIDTMTWHDNNINDLCTQFAPVQTKKEINQSLISEWNMFIAEIMCHQNDMIEFLQRAVGYILCKDNAKKCMFLLFGPTFNNGKTTFLKIISNVMGEYATSITSSTICQQSELRAANPELIDCKNKKLIICGELNSRTLLSNELIKLITGNDNLAERRLHDNNIQHFSIGGKLFANCNELPPLSNTDLLDSQRIIVIPFDKSFKNNERKTNLVEKFSSEEFKTIILNWILEGYNHYLKYGIQEHMPKKVTNAIDNYKSQSTSINIFLSEMTQPVDMQNYDIALQINKELYKKYNDWCEDNNFMPENSNKFYLALSKVKGYVNDTIKNKIRYKKIILGIALKDNIKINNKTKTMLIIGKSNHYTYQL